MRVHYFSKDCFSDGDRFSGSVSEITCPACRLEIVKAVAGDDEAMWYAIKLLADKKIKATRD